MAVFYRSGGLPTVEDLENVNAGWFDSVSEAFLTGSHVPRSESVFMTLTVDDVFMWAERRIVQGLDGTIFEVTVPDEVVPSLYAYQYHFYDDAHRAFDNPHYWGVDAVVDFRGFVSAYWLSGRSVDHWLRMWMSCHEDYDNSVEWEVKVPLAVASAARWDVFREHEELVEEFNLSEFLARQ